jgi:hypothetical protein
VVGGVQLEGDDAGSFVDAEAIVAIEGSTELAPSPRMCQWRASVARAVGGRRTRRVLT